MDAGLQLQGLSCGVRWSGRQCIMGNLLESKEHTVGDLLNQPGAESERR